jgi:hypothetical protein
VYRRLYRKVLVFSREAWTVDPEVLCPVPRVKMAFFEAEASPSKSSMVPEFTWSVEGLRRPRPPWDKLKSRG